MNILDLLSQDTKVRRTEQYICELSQPVEC